MDFDHISQYIFPILVLLFYLFVGGRKKKQQKPPQQEEEQDSFEEEEDFKEEPYSLIEPQKLLSLPQRAASSLPPAKRHLSEFESAISSRKISTHIEKREYVSAISDERAQSLVSSGLSDRIDDDQSYAIKGPSKRSRGRALLNKSGLKGAFILQEIFKRRDGF